MNRPTMTRFAALVCASLLWACGEDGPGGSSDTPFGGGTPDAADVAVEVAEPDPDVGPATDPEVAEPDPDVGPDVAEIVVPPVDAPHEVIEEIAVGPECVAHIDCEAKLADQLVDCEEALCDDGACVIDPIDDCCLADADCTGLSEDCCKPMTCDLETSQCVEETIEGCCQTSAQCNDFDAETTDHCASACATNGCAYLPPLCDNNVTYLAHGFDDPGLAGLQIGDAEGDDLVHISAQKGKTVSPEYSLYFGDPDCQTYYTGEMDGCTPTDFLGMEGSVITLEVTLDDVTLAYEEHSYLGFWVHMAAEPALAADDVLYPTDYLRVSVDIGEGQPTVVWRSPDALGAENTTHGEWLYQVVDLTPFKGKNVTVSLAFIADHLGNFNFGAGEAWYGAYVDDLIIRTACEPCPPGSLCSPDFDGCTHDACVAVHDNPQTGLCTYHSASQGTLCQPCAQPGDCGDDPCVDYTCDAGYCAATITAECCDPFSSYPYDTLPGAVAVQGFEVIGIATWSVDDPYPDDNIGWAVVEGEGYQSSASLYFGDPASGDFVADPANPAVGIVWSPSFQVSGETGMPTVLSFWLDLSTEYDLVEGVVDPSISYDLLTVYLQEVGEEPVVVWDSASTLGNSTHGTWQQVGIDVTDWTDKFVHLGFGFDSKDVIGTGYGNNFGGVHIDTLTVSVYCQTECLSSTSCDDGDTCTTNACVFGLCETTQPDPHCCHQDADCSHENPCVDTVCVEGQCQYTYSEVMSCCSEGPWLDPWAADFEADDPDWTIIASTPPVVWSRTNTDARSGSWSYNFADPTTGLYSYSAFDEELGVDVGQQTGGRLISPPIFVPPFNTGSPFAEFWLRLQTEWDLADPGVFEPAIPIDELRVFAAVSGDFAGAVQLWNSHYMLNTTHGDWRHTFVDLDDYRGEEVQLLFEFVSGDGNFNDFAGAFVDDVQFGTTCKAPAVIQCFDGGDCPQLDACTAVGCDEDFTCVFSPINTPQCCEPTDMSDMALLFEEGAEQWEATTCDPEETSAAVPVDPNSYWHVSHESGTGGISAKYGEGMLYFGNGVDYGGAAGAAACGRAMSPPITIEESDAPWELSGWFYIDVEPAKDCGQGVGAPWLDVFTLEIVEEDTGDSTLFLVKDGLLCPQYGSWTHQSWDVTPWTGKTVRFRVGFNSWDHVTNTSKGIAIDELRFQRGCADL